MVVLWVPMPGRPFLRKLTKDIQAVAETEGYERGIDWLCEQVAQGRRMKDIVEPFGCSRNFIYTYINAHGEEGKRLLAEARRRSAEAYADEAMELADDCPPDQAYVSKTKEQISVRKWLAGAYDRNTYGPRPEVQVLAIGEIHLDALRHAGAPPALEGGEAEAIEDVEVLRIEEGSSDD